MRSIQILLPLVCLLLAPALRAQTAGGRQVRVLLEDTHRQARNQGRYNFAQGVMARVLEEEGATVESSSRLVSPGRDLTVELLSRFDMVIMNGRYRPDNAAAFAAETIQAVERYVYTGGFLFVIAWGGHIGDGDHFSFYNPLLKPYGIKLDTTEFLYKPALVDRRGKEHPLMKDLDFIRPLHGTTLTTSNPKSWVLARIDDKPCLCVVPHGLGWVVVLGGGSGWQNQGMEDRPPFKPDAERVEVNQRLVRNLAGWLRIHQPMSSIFR
jgi:hypothetical protein